VVAVFEAMIDQGLYMESGAYRDLVGHDDVAGAYLRVTRGMESDVVDHLEGLGGVASVSSRAAFMRTIDEQLHESMTFVLGTIIASACIIAVGVVYNAARIALAERGRELGSLRVLGFTSGEIARMLLAEEVIIVALAIPVGLWLGVFFSQLLATAFTSERLQFPFVISGRSKLLAIGIVAASAAAASLVVYRRIRRLNLVTVLRTRE
jgi:putative ABC transport system permease protein